MFAPNFRRDIQATSFGYLLCCLGFSVHGRASRLAADGSSHKFVTCRVLLFRQILALSPMSRLRLITASEAVAVGPI